jgi:molybdate transport system substrate-binding protein
LVAGALGAWAGAADADRATIAVAANFLNPLDAIKAEFEAGTVHELVVVSGSTGQLYAQITNGAPFDVLLAADAERPARLAEESWGDPTSIFTYARGRVALWSRRPELVDASTLERLGAIEFRWLAIANPELAPYGMAARHVLESLGLWEALQPRIVRGQSIATAFAMAETGNAEIGLVALSQALAYAKASSHAVVPERLHEPIRQDAILLGRAADNKAAREFMTFLRGAAAGEIIERYGYDVLP